MLLPKLLPLAVAGAALVAAPAQAGQATFKVIKATHTSSSTKATSDYHGTSTASWKLAKGTSSAPNRVTVSRVMGTTTGLGQVNVKGSYSIDATTKLGHCAWTAPTGDEEHGLSAPQPFTFALGPDPHTGEGLYAGLTFGAVAASLGNPYLGTECSTELDGEPDGDEVGYTPVKPSAFKRKKVTITWKGATNREGVDYRWTTTVVLKRVR